MRITIFGAGSYGNALGHVLKENNHQITYYDPRKFPGILLDKALENPEVLIMVAPSVVAEDLLSSLPSFTHDLPLICASKGFLSLDPFRHFKDFSIIGGPTFSSDLEAHHPTILSASSELPIKLFSTSWLKLELVADNLGILLCGTLKNIYAIESGYRNLSPTKESFLTFVSQAHNEMKLILEANGCNPTTADHACGLADLTMTCASSASRNYAFGQALSKDPNAKPHRTTEGVNAIFSLPSVPTFIIPDNTPILNSIIAKIHNI